jgi:HAD superfamily hydrolase (TIGR01509 family)
MRALIFDLDGTLIDTVYAHVIAWQRSFAGERMNVSARIFHAKIGLGGKELAITVARESGNPISHDQAEALDQRHSVIMKELLPRAEPLPGATALLHHLRELKVPYGIATSGDRSGLEEPLRRLGISDDVVVACKSDVERAKPEPDLFVACQQRLNVVPKDCFVVGDAIWDMLGARRSGMLGVGVLTGGIGKAELTQAGAYRVYRDPAELNSRLYELGFVDGEA